MNSYWQPGQPESTSTLPTRWPSLPAGKLRRSEFFPSLRSRLDSITAASQVEQQNGHPMKQALADHLAFFTQFRETFMTTGAIAPSSRFLARAMTAPLARRTGPIRVLEIGPGTGAVTDHLVRLLQPDDQFDLVELNPKFVEILQDRFGSQAHYQHVAHCSKVHQLPLQDFESHRPL